MGKFSGYLLLSDMDGTLTDPEGNISTENMDAIRYFQEEGGRFTIATGRMPDYIRAFPYKLNAPVCAINGTMICSEDGDVLERIPMEFNFADAIRYVIDNYPCVHMIRRHHEDYYTCWLRDNHTEEETTQLLYGTDVCYKFVFECHGESNTVDMMKDLEHRYGHLFALDRSWPVGLELHHINSGKGACVRKIRHMLPDVHTVITVGDYENDLTMLVEADVGCAVSNAIQSVKDAADRIIVSRDEHAIAYIVHTVIPEMIHGGT